MSSARKFGCGTGPPRVFPLLPGRRFPSRFAGQRMAELGSGCRHIFPMTDKINLRDGLAERETVCRSKQRLSKGRKNKKREQKIVKSKTEREREKEFAADWRGRNTRKGKVREASKQSKSKSEWAVPSDSRPGKPMTAPPHLDHEAR